MSLARINGFSYAEVLVAVAILAIALVPAMDALHTGLAGSAGFRVDAVDVQNRLILSSDLVEFTLQE